MEDTIDRPIPSGAEEARRLSRVLMHGSFESRRAEAQRLRDAGAADLWAMLVSTVRSEEPLVLRARCLELLGLIAGEADEPVARALLDLLVEGSPPHAHDAPDR